MLTDPGSAGYSFVRTTTGAKLAELPPGILSYALSGGGDLAEAYLTRGTESGGAEIDTIRPERGYALQKVAEATSPPRAALLVRAALDVYVGQPNVLLMVTADGRMIAYQHGMLIWSDSVSGPSDLRQVGGKAYAVDRNGWAPIRVATGGRDAILTARSCVPGPIAEVAGGLLLDCNGTLSGSLVRVPPDAPLVVTTRGAAFLVFADGEVWKADQGSAHRLATGVVAAAPPVAAPDGRSLLVPTATGVELVDTTTGSHRRLLAATGISSIASSRDGNYLYVVAGGRFTTYATSSGARVRSFATDRSRIYLVAGG